MSKLITEHILNNQLGNMINITNKQFTCKIGIILEYWLIAIYDRRPKL